MVSNLVHKKPIIHKYNIWVWFFCAIYSFQIVGKATPATKIFWDTGNEMDHQNINAEQVLLLVDEIVNKVDPGSFKATIVYEFSF